MKFTMSVGHTVEGERERSGREKEQVDAAGAGPVDNGHASDSRIRQLFALARERNRPDRGIPPNRSKELGR